MSRPRLRIALVATAVLALGVPAVAAAGPEECLDPSPDGALCLVGQAGTVAQDAEAPLVVPRDTARTTADLALEAAGVCDPTDRAHCLLPFPNDTFTVADASTPTGRRISISPLATPRNVAGKPMDPTELNRNDGWSPGATILASVPGLDLARTGAAGITDLQASLAPDAPIVVLDAATGQRHPYWAELDSNRTDGEQPLLIVRPAVNFAEGHRYVVGLRGMKDAAGNPIAPNPVFAERRDEAQRALGKPDKGNNGKGSGSDKPKKDKTDPVFGPLADAGIEPKDLYLAWTFTIASTESITGRMLHMRDTAFAPLGADGAPAFTTDEPVANPSGDTARRITGTFTVPNFLTSPANTKEPVLGSDPGLPGTRLLDVDQDGKPEQNGTFTATYTCNIPKSATVDAPSRGAIYGHGLLGGQGEVNGSSAAPFGNAHNITFCATDWYGMATGDVPNVATMLADMSNFATLPDRVQQGILAQLFLARLVKSPKGFASSPAFQTEGKPLLQPGEVFYDGNSQGGIIGGALMAVAQDITRGALGVPGMNYSTLLDRSVDFAQYEAVFNAAYPSELEREIVFGLIQMLWDRGEANGYAAHISKDPLPGTPAHQVLLHVAFGDHQVANVAAEVMARTIGAQTNPGYLDAGRHWAVDPTWGIPTAPAGWTGSAFVYWDSGTDTPPNGNVPPAHGDGVAGHDPHSDPRKDAEAKAQKSEFLRTGGVFTDTCLGLPCYAGSYAGR